jgi:hypothetical protein
MAVTINRTRPEDQRNSLNRGGGRLLLATIALLALLSLAQVAMPGLAGAHGPSSGDGRIPGHPDLERIGNTTYRFVPSMGQYEVRRPGEPAFYLHADLATSPPSRSPGLPDTALAEGATTELPTQTDAPVCRNSGRRIVVVATRRPGQNPVSASVIREIIARMNWKIQDQAARASGGQRTLQMVTECDSSGEVKVHDVQTPDNEYTTVFAAVPNALYKEPTGSNSIKYLIFDSGLNPKYAGVAQGIFHEAKTGNIATERTRSGLIVAPWWSSHAPIHELFHTLGAVPLGAPGSTGAGHCTDGLDVMCYDDGGPKGALYSESFCPASEGYETPVTLPIDCGLDSYFHPNPPAGNWLATHWDIGGPEDPFLIASPRSVTEKAQSIQSTKAVLRGAVNPYGSVTKVHFEYGTTASYGTSTANETMGSGEALLPVARAISGLTLGATYHYRLVAESEGGVSYGADQTFKTFDARPIVATQAAVGFTPSGARLSGTVNPNNLDTTYTFEYGPTTSYGSQVPVTPKSIGAGTSAVAVSEALSGLSPKTTYHYRLVATNAEGSTLGADQTLTTVRADVPARLEAERYPADIVVEQGTAHVLAASTGNVKCATASFTVATSTAVETLTATPIFAGCKAFGVSATAITNGCQYSFKVPNANPPYAGTMEILCGGNAIEFVASTISCRVGIPSQTIPVSFENSGSGTARIVTASLNTSALQYTETGSSCVGPGSHTDGSFSGSTIFRGSSGGNPVGVNLAGVQSQGFRLTGSASAEPANQPRFEPDSYPAALGAEQTVVQTLNAATGTVKCATVEFSGSSPAASNSVALTPVYSGCKAFGVSATVAPNSCRYAFGVQNAGPPYVGALTISCEKSGDTIKITPVGVSCEVTVPAQTIPGSVAYENSGTGSRATVKASISTAGLTYTETGAGCASAGTHSNGALTGGTWIWAL